MGPPGNPGPPVSDPHEFPSWRLNLCLYLLEMVSHWAQAETPEDALKRKVPESPRGKLKDSSSKHGSVINEGDPGTEAHC